ncbi:acetyltransferase [Achromobacter sp. DMS1]|uniref:acyltransferase n=1 Tax=Achromobacter sp. DMS1 TaxID=1688405 RepID=UPI00069FC231|nr:acyltransferase [Achromobacter sp. DMS1]KOF52354.1 acetyltransferase [Achromobacter sp. DMS1]KOF52357.1 acetyltransferase [Achromobacter sp. DMS1]
MIRIDASARVSPLADIEDSVRGTVIEIGPGAVVDAFVKIKPAGGTGDVVIGENSVINSGCVLYTGNGIRIGRGVAVAANCTFAPTNHEFRRKDLPIRQQGFRPGKGGIVVEDDVWIGANCVLLDGAVLRQGCVIAAGTVVRGEVDAYSIQGGNPMRRLGQRENTGEPA